MIAFINFMIILLVQHINYINYIYTDLSLSYIDMSEMYKEIHYLIELLNSL